MVLPLLGLLESFRLLLTEEVVQSYTCRFNVKCDKLQFVIK